MRKKPFLVAKETDSARILEEEAQGEEIGPGMFSLNIDNSWVDWLHGNPFVEAVFSEILSSKVRWNWQIWKSRFMQKWMSSLKLFKSFISHDIGGVLRKCIHSRRFQSISYKLSCFFWLYLLKVRKNPFLRRSALASNSLYLALSVSLLLALSISLSLFQSDVHSSRPYPLSPRRALSRERPHL